MQTRQSFTTTPSLFWLIHFTSCVKPFVLFGNCWYWTLVVLAGEKDAYVQRCFGDVYANE